MLKKKHIPVLGMVANMAEAVCPHCHQSYYPFIDKSVDLVQFCADKRWEIPYLVSIPFTSEQALLDTAFDKLAEMVVTRKPVAIWKKGIKVVIEQTAMKGAMVAKMRQVAKEG
jgi:hypothetical protein